MVLTRYGAEIVNTVRHPLVLMDKNLSVRFANPAFYTTFRLRADEVEGRALFSLRPGESDLPILRTLLGEELPKRGVVENIEIEQDFPSLGGRRVFLVNGRLLAERPGEEQLILLAMEDVTSQRRAAEAAASNSRSLGRNNLELRRSNGELAQFAQIASHDLQEPLRKIRTFGSMLRDSAAAKLDPEELDLLDRANNAAGRAQRLITDVLALARVTSHEPNWRRLDLDDVVRGVLSDLELQISERGASMEIGRLPTIEADAPQLRQVFQNLLSNALKFCRAGEKPIVKVSATETQIGGERAFAISVTDNGIGFDEDYATAIFEPFHRLHRRDEYEGTGMGLAICKRVAEQHGGYIVARSRLGQGSEFIITLPARQQHERSTS